jgi:hypothetical protein
VSDWNCTEHAIGLLAELDAAERASDCYAGWGWRDVSRSCSERAQEIECELDELRRAAVDAIADAASDDRDSDEWLDAWTEADDELVTVEWACQQARRSRAGDVLMERAAAA